MTYEKPAIRDLGDITKHTYFQGDDEIIYCGASADLCDDATF